MQSIPSPTNCFMQFWKLAQDFIVVRASRGQAHTCQPNLNVCRVFTLSFWWHQNPQTKMSEQQTGK